MKFTAGIWEQYQELEDGVGLVEWSRHSTKELAVRAARRYARAKTRTAGGPLSWYGGVLCPDGQLTWYGADGAIRAICAKEGHYEWV